jgi:hypothetical protein
MALFRKEKKLLPHQWSLAVIASRMVASYVSGTEGGHVRAAVIFHVDPELVPTDMDERQRATAEAEEHEYGGYFEWQLLGIEFLDDDFGGDDRVSLYMDHDPTALVRGRGSLPTFEAAAEEARAWVGAEGQECSFRALPGVFQRAAVCEIAEEWPEHHAADLMWAPGIDNGKEWQPQRQFPPDLKKLEAGEGEWTILPLAAIEELLASRGW